MLSNKGLMQSFCILHSKIKLEAVPIETSTSSVIIAVLFNGAK